MLCGITQCYLPPGRGDIHDLTPAEAGARFNDPGGMQSWVDLDIAVSAQPEPKAAYRSTVAINTTVHGEIQTWVLSHRNRTRWPLGAWSGPNRIILPQLLISLLWTYVFRATGQGGRGHGSNQPRHESGRKEPGRNGKVLWTLRSTVEKVRNGFGLILLSAVITLEKKLWRSTVYLMSCMPKLSKTADDFLRWKPSAGSFITRKCSRVSSREHLNSDEFFYEPTREDIRTVLWLNRTVIHPQANRLTVLILKSRVG